MYILRATGAISISDFLHSSAHLHAAVDAAGTTNAEGERELHQEVLEAYEHHSASLLRFARITTGEDDGSLAQDAVQEAFFSYFLHRREGNSVDDPRRWLQQRLKDFLDRAMARSQRDESALAGSSPNTSGVPEIFLDVQRRLPQLLSPRELQAMRLRAEGFRYVEIAESLSVTVGTVGTMIARAVKKLQSEFGPRENLGHGRSED